VEPAVSTTRASSNGVLSLFREHRFGGEMKIIQIAVRLKRLALHARSIRLLHSPRDNTWRDRGANPIDGVGNFLKVGGRLRIGNRHKPLESASDPFVPLSPVTKTVARLSPPRSTPPARLLSRTRRGQFALQPSGAICNCPRGVLLRSTWTLFEYGRRGGNASSGVVIRNNAV
jgi:hypothetical protein